MKLYENCMYYKYVLGPNDTCARMNNGIVNLCSKCPRYYKNQGGKTMEKLSVKRLPLIDIDRSLVAYSDVWPIIHRLAEYETFDMTPEEIGLMINNREKHDKVIISLEERTRDLETKNKGLEQDVKALERDLERKNEELADCSRTIVELRKQLIKEDPDSQCCCEVEHFEFTPQDYIRIAVDSLLRATEEISSYKNA